MIKNISIMYFKKNQFSNTLSRKFHDIFMGITSLMINSLTEIYEI
jgi:hypothetical protein